MRGCQHERFGVEGSLAVLRQPFRGRRHQPAHHHDVLQWREFKKSGELSHLREADGIVQSAGRGL